VPYPLPGFVSKTLASQPSPPRRVALQSVVRAVVGGLDCAIYVGAALVLIAAGVAAAAWYLVAVGIACGLLALFRIWQVESVLQSGDAHMAEVVEAQVGRARIYGTPWGEPMGTRMQPIAARGSYRVISSGETGRYYMQQSWALALQPSMRIWVLRRNGRDVLYAPVGPGA
jgi:hypothetical protein